MIRNSLIPLLNSILFRSYLAWLSASSYQMVHMIWAIWLIINEPYDWSISRETFGEIFKNQQPFDYTNKLVLICSRHICYELRKSTVKKGCGNSKFLQRYRVEIRKIKNGRLIDDFRWWDISDHSWLIQLVHRSLCTVVRERWKEEGRISDDLSNIPTEVISISVLFQKYIPRHSKKSGPTTFGQTWVSIWPSKHIMFMK